MWLSSSFSGNTKQQALCVYLVDMWARQHNLCYHFDLVPPLSTLKLEAFGSHFVLIWASKTPLWVAAMW